jgi:hypothetical protein
MLQFFFSKICRGNSILIQSGRSSRYFTSWRMYGFDHISLSLSVLLRIRNVSDKFLEKIKHSFYSFTLSRESCRLWDNVENYCRSGEVTDDNIVRRMHFACGINKFIDTHSEYISLIAVSLQMVTRRHINLTYYANYRSYFLIRLSCHTPADNHATTLLPPSLSPFIPS